MRSIKKFSVAIACGAVALAAMAGSAHAALANLAIWDNNAQIISQGLPGVQFNTVGGANGQFVALGAHPYVNGVTMPNDGVSTFYANPGTNPAAPAGQTRANWSFDFGFTKVCDGCSVLLTISDNNDATNSVSAPISFTDIDAGSAYLESWNLEMSFLSGFDFDPFASSSTNFTLTYAGVTGAPIASTSINVVVQAVPEPGSIALLGLGLAGLVAIRKRKQA